MTIEKATKTQALLTMLGSNYHALYIFMTELLFCFATLTVDIMVSSRIWTRCFWVHISDVTITPDNWSGLYPYLCGKHMCKADPSVGHQNRRANTQLKALTPVLPTLLLWPCVTSPSRKTPEGWRNRFQLFVRNFVYFDTQQNWSARFILKFGCISLL